MRDLSAPVSHWMIDAVDPQPGQRVLELAAGLGETGFLAAEMVAPVGGLITSDQADAMLDGARRRANELGLTNVEFQVFNAEWIDLPVASCRRRALPLGLHADGRSVRRARRDATRVATGRARRARGMGRARAQPLGAAPGRGAARARPDAAAARRGPWAVRAGRGAARARTARTGRLPGGVGAAARPHPERGELRRVLGDDARHVSRLPRRGARPPRGGDRRHPRLARGAPRAIHRGRRLARDTDAHAFGSSGLPEQRRSRIPCAPMLYDDDATSRSSTARPSRSSATALKATPTRST